MKSGLMVGLMLGVVTLIAEITVNATTWPVPAGSGTAGYPYWYIKTVSNIVVAWADQWGWSTAKPVPGDYDGDGKFDLAVFDTQGGYWYIKSLSGKVIAWKVQWGWNTAKPISGDLDGDGKYDLAMYDTVSNLWYVKSLDGRVHRLGCEMGLPRLSCSDFG